MATDEKREPKVIEFSAEFAKEAADLVLSTVEMKPDELLKFVEDLVGNAEGTQAALEDVILKLNHLKWATRRLQLAIVPHKDERAMGESILRKLNREERAFLRGMKPEDLEQVIGVPAPIDGRSKVNPPGKVETAAEK